MSNIIRITDFQAPELDPVARMTENQLVSRRHPEQGRFIAETPMVIRRALDGGYRPLSFLMEEGLAEGAGREFLTRCPEVPVYVAPGEVLSQLTGYPLTRGMLAVIQRPKLPTAEALCKNARRVAVLEEVMNPTNVGAIIRSAAALNIDAVLLTPGCSDPLYRRASRVSMGTVFQVPWGYLEGDRPYTEQLRELGFKTVAMALREDSCPIYAPELGQVEKLAIVLGTEGEGLAGSTIEACDFTVKIPMTHGVDSLNVAAASAVAFYQLALLGGM